jgi:hypothetical protein
MNRPSFEQAKVYWLKGSTSKRDRRCWKLPFVPPRPQCWQAVCYRRDRPELRRRCAAGTGPCCGVAHRPVRLVWPLPSGWIDILENLVSFEIVYHPMDQGDLASRYDVLIFADGSDREATRSYRIRGIPAEYRDAWGTRRRETIPQLRIFLEQGGTVLAIGARRSGIPAGLPIMSAALSEKEPTAQTAPPSKSSMSGSFPGSRRSGPLAHGLSETVDVFDKSPVFRLRPEAALSGLRGGRWSTARKPRAAGPGVKLIWSKARRSSTPASAKQTPVLKSAFRAQPTWTFKFRSMGSIMEEDLQICRSASRNVNRPGAGIGAARSYLPGRRRDAATETGMVTSSPTPAESSPAD